MDAEAGERIKGMLRMEIEWSYLLKIARIHGILPLLYQHLEAMQAGSVPATIMDQLRDHFYTNTRRNVILAAELLKLLNLFNAHHVPAIPFRGPALAASAYGDLALRQFGDLDILVHTREVLKAVDLLMSHGYQPIFPLPARREVILQRGEYAFLLASGEVFVDLHWAATQHDLFPHDLEMLQGRLQPVSLDAHTILTLSWQDQLILLCIHGAKHNWRRLIWICDVAELLRIHSEIDGRRLMEDAQRLGTKRMVALGLFLASNLLGAPIPENLRVELQADKVVASLGGQVHSRLFQEKDDRKIPSEDPIFYARTMDRMRDRIRFCLERLVTPTPWVLAHVRLPYALFFLYYLVRPLQLAKIYGLHTLRRVYHGKLAR